MSGNSKVWREVQARTAETLLPEACPRPPVSLGETGLRRELVTELVMKAVYFAGECTGQEAARTVKLSYSVLEEVFGFLRSEKFVEVKGIDGRGKTSFRYQMTEAGRARTREFLERSQYVGPAPVSLDDYVRWVRRQSVLDHDPDPAFLRRGLGHLVVADEVLDSLGPAVLSGRSLFLYGPAGNGKTVLAEGIAASMSGSIFVPHAIEVDGQIIKVFDRATHVPVELKRAADERWQQAGAPYDARWVLTKRPVVITGGELTLPMLDLQFNPVSKYYEAPFQVKANGGVFVLDDFGRQQVQPHDLLNRWIVPLEKREDFLTLHTGKKFSVPFDSLIIFSTNLNPWDLVDEAFLRRIRYKIPVENPTREQYEQLFQRMCETKGIEYRSSAVEFIYTEYYGNRGFHPRFCHPRDLVEHIHDAYRYHGGNPRLYHKVVVKACENYFLQNPFDTVEPDETRRAAPLR
ncbi:MAG: ATP-binding protein [Gemmatimonadota bacterium]